MDTAEGEWSTFKVEEEENGEDCIWEVIVCCKSPAFLKKSVFPCDPIWLWHHRRIKFSVVSKGNEKWNGGVNRAQHITNN